MCPLLGILEIQSPSANSEETAQVAYEIRLRALQLGTLLRVPDPGSSSLFADEHAVLVHGRPALSPSGGATPAGPDGGVDAPQPLGLEGRLILAATGDITNHRALTAELSERFAFRTDSSCEVITPLHQEHGIGLLERLEGVFAFVLYDRRSGKHLIARDRHGGISLFMGWDDCGRLHVAGRSSVLEPVCPRIEAFPPGHFLTSGMDDPARYDLSG